MYYCQRVHGFLFFKTTEMSCGVISKLDQINRDHFKDLLAPTTH